jgi:hypothetical protein
LNTTILFSYEVERDGVKVVVLEIISVKKVMKVEIIDVTLE